MKILTREGRAEIEIRKSRFLAESFIVESQEEARAVLKAQKEIHAGSSHVVHAFVIGPTGGITGCSDDGEPSGTAGRPALDVLKGSGITNVLITVARWFGGTELGTGGLVKAYGASIRAVLEVSPSEEQIPMMAFSVTVTYESFERCRREMIGLGAEIGAETFGTDVEIRGRVCVASAPILVGLITDLTSGQSAVALSEDSPRARKT